MQKPVKEAVILLGHGSRVPGAGEGMEKLAARMRERMRQAIVEFCYMSKIGPHFPETFEKCIAQGATKMIVLPYFLHEGLHIREDIPEILLTEAKKHPGVELIQGRTLGYDDSLLDLVCKRFEESRSLPGVRNTKQTA